MSAAIEIDGRAVTVSFVSENLKKAIQFCNSEAYREAMHCLCREVSRLSEEIAELEDRLESAS